MIEQLERKYDANTFSHAIEVMVTREGLDYLEAIAAFAERNGLEVEAVAQLVKKSEPIRLKLEAHCRRVKLLEPTAELPLEELMTGEGA